ncbi:hypothetical protein F7725_005211 [Dissostichus mawsoni]|uniref:D-aminoacyl-tRNA deacylase n=1 Tax=Dissostichus mawsoni TaxID=36200 RepID=A0A7J5YQR3_DISMA|nr:hypothetical protein F7725_005211 [Dissostichus mawsoni]
MVWPSRPPAEREQVFCVSAAGGRQHPGHAVGLGSKKSRPTNNHNNEGYHSEGQQGQRDSGDEEVSSIGRGLCVLLGISVEDTQKDVDYLVRKILNMRLFEDENGRAWSKSVMDRDFECVLKGNKPDFHAAMPAELAQPFYNSILENMRSSYKPELIKGG